MRSDSRTTSNKQIPNRLSLVETLEARRLFSVPGIPVQTYQIPQGTNFPANLTVTADSNIWYTSGLSAYVGWISPDGTVAPPINTSSASTHGMDGLTVGKDGKIWFCEFWDNVVGVIGNDGQIQTYALNKKYGPESITLGPGNHLWITTSDNFVGRINSVAHGKANVTWFKHKKEGIKQIISWNKAVYIQETDKIARFAPGTGFREFALPSGGTVSDLAVGADGNLWFTENGKSGSTNDFVGYLNKSGKIVELPISNAQGNLAGITHTATGNLIFCQGSFLQEIDTKGNLLASQYLGLVASAGSITLGGDGNVWFAESVTGKIGKATV